MKIFRLNPKKQGAGGQNPKINTEYLKTRVLQGFLKENPKIENFQIKKPKNLINKVLF